MSTGRALGLLDYKGPRIPVDMMHGGLAMKKAAKRARCWHNIVARFYLRRCSAGRIAASAISAGDVFIPKTVILELEWVLRYVADQPESKVIACLAHVIALPRIMIEDRDDTEAALAHFRNGIDLADAPDLAASESCSELLMFDDRAVTRRAKKLSVKPPVRVPNR